MSDDISMDYEELPQGASTPITLLAGALAGITEHTVTYPLDSIKVSKIIRSVDDH